MQQTMRAAFTGTALSAKTRVQAPRVNTVVRAGKAGSYFPGQPSPSYLDGSLPGDYGFDPLRLGQQKDALNWYAQAELVHGRFAMLGAAGVLFPELLASVGQGGPAAATPWFDAGKFDYFAPASTLFIVQMILFGWVEIRRLQDIRNPGSVNEDPIFSGNKVPNPQVGYPGGIFDPMGFSKGNFEELKLKEIKNGRLAMFAFLGFAAQASATGTTPLQGLAAHLANPFAVNFATNGVSLPKDLGILFFVPQV